MSSTAVDSDSPSVSDEVSLDDSSGVDQEAQQYDTQSEADAAPELDGNLPSGHFMASCAQHICFILKCFESV